MRLTITHTYHLSPGELAAVVEAFDLIETLRTASALREADVLSLQKTADGYRRDRTLCLNLTVLLPLLRLVESATGYCAVRDGPSAARVRDLHALRERLMQPLQT